MLKEIASSVISENIKNKASDLISCYCTSHKDKTIFYLCVASTHSVVCKPGLIKAQHDIHLHV